jgi:hypothetical protein
MKEIRILGIYISERNKDAIAIQNLFTKFGCSIKTRLGLHEVVDNYCSSSGLVILELTGLIEEMDLFESELNKLNGVEVQKMIFNK